MSTTTIIEISKHQFSTIEADQGRSILEKYRDTYCHRRAKRPTDHFFTWFYLDSIHTSSSIKICDLPTAKHEPFVRFEIVPMAELKDEDGHGACEDESQAEFWSVLAKTRGAGYVELATCTTNKLATWLRQRLEDYGFQSRPVTDRRRWYLYTHTELREAMAQILYLHWQEERKNIDPIIEEARQGASQFTSNEIAAIKTRFRAEFSLTKENESIEDFYSWIYIHHMKPKYFPILNVTLPYILSKDLHHLELVPIKVTDLEGSYEPCDVKDAEFWSVYVHLQGGDMVPVACCISEAIALSLKDELNARLRFIGQVAKQQTEQFRFNALELMEAMTLSMNALKENELFKSKTV